MGCRVTMIANPYYQSRIVGAGITFRGMGTREELLAVLHHPALARPWLSPLLIIRELIGKSVAPTVAAMEKILGEGEIDVVVRHHISLGSRWVAAARGIPCVTCVLAPMLLSNPNDPAVHRPGQSGDPSPRQMRWRLMISKYILRLLYDVPLNRQRRRLGFVPQRDLFRQEIEGCERVLGLWSPAMRGRVQGDVPHLRICGVCTFDGGDGNSAPFQSEFDEFVRACGALGKAPVIFTLGTSIVHHHNGFYELAAPACESLGLPAVLLVGDMAYAPKRLPRMVRAFDYAPYRAVFPAASMIVHHGGAGTTAAAMMHGKPTVIVPFANDEFDNAARGARLGVSVTLRAGGLREAGLRAAILKVSESKSMEGRARSLAAVMAKERVTAAEEIIEVAMAHRRGRVA